MCANVHHQESVGLAPGDANPVHRKSDDSVVVGLIFMHSSLALARRVTIYGLAPDYLWAMRGGDALPVSQITLLRHITAVSTQP